jgi:hypothetical protein
MKQIISTTLAVVIVLAGVLFSGQITPAFADPPKISHLVI